MKHIITQYMCEQIGVCVHVLGKCQKTTLKQKNEYVS